MMTGNSVVPLNIDTIARKPLKNIEVRGDAEKRIFLFLTNNGSYYRNLIITAHE
jgi:hypothetical protein